MQGNPLPPGFVWEDEDPPQAAVTLPDGFIWEDEIKTAAPEIPTHQLPGKNRRKRGRLYDTPKGPAYWQGNGWSLPDENDRQDMSRLDQGPLVPIAQPKRPMKTDMEMGITETPGTLGRFVSAAREGFDEGYGKAPTRPLMDDDRYVPAPEMLAVAGGERALRSLGGAIRSGTHLGAQVARELGMGDSSARRFERDLVGLVDTAGLVTGGVNMPGYGTRTINKAQRQANRIKEVEAFDRLGVRQFAPSLTGAKLEAATQGVSHIPFAGKPIENAMIQSVGDASKAATDIAGELSDARQPYQLGEAIQGGLSRYRKENVLSGPVEALTDTAIQEVIRRPSRVTSFSTKQEALYEDAWRKMPARFKSNGAKNPDLVPTRNAKTVLRNIERIQSQIGVSGGALQGKFSGMAKKLTSQGNYTIETLRHMRTEVGRMLARGSDDNVNMDHRQLKQLYGAITEDIKGGLGRIADRAATDPNVSNVDTVAAFKALSAFERADKFTKTGIKRMDNMLSLTKANRPEEAANRLLRSVLDGGKGNINLLTSAKKTLRPDEWNDFLGVALREMGKPKPSARGIAQEVGFSVESFTTKWNALSDQGKQVMFSGMEPSVKRAIDDLVTVTNRLANYESFANRSNSGNNVIGAMGVVGGGSSLLGLSGGTLLKMFAAPYVFAKVVSTPGLAKWMSRTAKLSTRPNTSRQMAAQVTQLQLMAEKDPELSPIYEEVRRHWSSGELNEEQNNP